MIDVRRVSDGKAMLGGGLVAVLSLCGGCEGKSTPPPPPPPEVVVAKVEQQTIPIVLRFSGTLQAIRTVNIVPRVGGYIDKRYFTEGTRVKTGDPLYLIDPRPYQATLDSNKAQLSRDQANYTYWQEQVKRNKRLQKSGAASVEDLENAIAQESEAKAAIENDEANIQKAELDLSFTRINAPFDGRIENTKVHVGALVTAHQDTLTTLVQIDPIYAVFNVSRSQLDRIQQLMSDGVVKPGPLSQFETEVLLPDGRPYAHRGRMNFVSAQIDPTTDQMLARAEFPNVYEHPSDVRLIPGQYVPVRVYIGEQPNALLIPKAALVESQVGDVVYVVGDDDKVQARRVEVDRAHEGQWVIKKGLEKGERVIVEGTQKVHDGIVVKLQESPAGKD